MVTRGKREQGKDKLRVWDQQIQTTMYKTDTQQGPTVWHRNYIWCPTINHNGKEYEKECMYIYAHTHTHTHTHKTESFCYTRN